MTNFQVICALFLAAVCLARAGPAIDHDANTLSNSVNTLIFIQ